MRSLNRHAFRHLTAAGVAAALAIYSPFAWAQAGNAPNSNPGKNTGMGQMQHQMMMDMTRQMQGCMEQMGAAGMTDRTPSEQMRGQMMGQMQTCMDRMKAGAGTAPNTEPGQPQTPKNN